MGSERTSGTIEECAALMAQLASMRGQPHVSEAYLAFRVKVLEAQRAVRRELRAAAGDRSVTRPCRAPSSLPVTADTVVFDMELLRTLFAACCGAAAAHGQGSEDLRRLLDAATVEPGLPSALAEAAAFGPNHQALETIARRWGVYVEVLLFVGRVIAAPFVAETVDERWAAALPHGAEPHRCLACGSPPSIARLRRADGRRFLTCGLCGSEWEAIRLACACCGTAERDCLGILRLDDADPRWVETCEACKGYIKTVDERRLGEGEVMFPVVEETGTLHLDLLAEREGYIRRVPYVLSD